VFPPPPQQTTQEPTRGPLLPHPHRWSPGTVGTQLGNNPPGLAKKTPPPWVSGPLDPMKNVSPPPRVPKQKVSNILRKRVQGERPKGKKKNAFFFFFAPKRGPTPPKHQPGGTKKGGGGGDGSKILSKCNGIFFLIT